MAKGPTCWPISAVLIPAGSNGGGRKLSQIFSFVKKFKNQQIVSKLPNFGWTLCTTILHKNVHCLTARKKIKCNTVASDLSSSAIQCSAFTDNVRESWIPKDFTVFMYCFWCCLHAQGAWQMFTYHCISHFVYVWRCIWNTLCTLTDCEGYWCRLIKFHNLA